MNRGGVVLVSVMIVTALAAMVAAGLLFRMTASVSALAAMENGEQARQAAMSAIVRAETVLGLGLEDMDLWYDNPEAFRNQKVYDDGTNTWYFTIYAPDPLDAKKVRYGLIDEAGKININRAEADNIQLQALPMLTDEMIDCLLDYMDNGDDDQPRELGAEQEYYSRLPWPYTIKNGPVATVEELLLVKGFDASVVYGEDTNMNGLLDPNENDGDKTPPNDDANGQLDTGLLGLATTFRYSSGQSKVDINSAPEDMLEAMIEAGIPEPASKKTVDFIDARRLDGNPIQHPAQLLNAKYAMKEDRKLWDGTTLIAGLVIESGVDEQTLPLVLDTFAGGYVSAGMINVNTAPAAVLASVQGMDQAAAEAITTVRAGLDSQTKSTIAWLYTRGVLDEEKFKAVAPMLTAKSYQYRLRCIGFGVPCQRMCVLEAVIDIGRGSPRVVYLRELTRLGVPFAMDLKAIEESGS